MSPATRGIALMVLGSGLLTANDAISKYLCESLPVAQVWCLRAVSAGLLIAAVSRRYGGFARLWPTRWTAQLLRATTFVATTGLLVWGLSLMPLAEMSAIVFASPVFVVVLSALVLKERVGLHRWLGVVAGLAGVLLIVQPGSAVFGIGALVAAAAAFTSALRDIITRALCGTEHPMAILNVSNSMVLVIGLAIAPWIGWLKPTLAEVAWLALNGALNACAHLAVIESLRAAEASAVAPYKYTALIWSVILGAVVFSQVPGPMAVVGAVIVVASGLYILHRERVRAPF